MTTIYTSKKKEFGEAATINSKFSITNAMKKAFPSLKDYDFYDFKIEDDKMTIVAFKKEPEKLEPINPDEFQIITITSEMKSKYHALKKYKELIISGKFMNWFDAMDYAKKNRAVLPDKNEGKDVIELIKDSGWTSYFWFWSREEYNTNNAYAVSSGGYINYYYDKIDSRYCFCVR